MINEKILGNIPTDINKLKINFENLKGKILWQNNSPSSPIPAEKTISLSSGDYDFIEVFYKHNTSINYLYSQKIIKGYGSRLGIETLDGIIYRNLDWVNNTTYQISTIQVENPNNKDDRIIPILIVGYKNGLFE